MRTRLAAASVAAALVSILIASPVSAATMNPVSGPNTGGTFVYVSGAGSFGLITRVQLTCGSTVYTVAPTTVSPDGSALSFVTPSVSPFVGACTVATVNPSVSLPDFTFTGIAPPGPLTKDDCKDDGWMTFTDPAFKNQGECVAYVETQ
jgi:hypothetical protein